MAYFKDDNDLYRIHLKDFDGSEEWVDIWNTESWKARYEYLTRGAAASQAWQEGTQTVVQISEMSEVRMILLRNSICAWSFKDKNGNPIPVSIESLERMEDSLASYLQIEILNHYNYQRRTEEEKNRVEEGAAGQST